MHTENETQEKKPRSRVEKGARRTSSRSMPALSASLMMYPKHGILWLMRPDVTVTCALTRRAENGVDERIFENTADTGQQTGMACHGGVKRDVRQPRSAGRATTMHASGDHKKCDGKKR